MDSINPKGTDIFCDFKAEKCQKIWQFLDNFASIWDVQKVPLPNVTQCRLTKFPISFGHCPVNSPVKSSNF